MTTKPLKYIVVLLLVALTFVVYTMQSVSGDYSITPTYVSAQEVVPVLTSIAHTVEVAPTLTPTSDDAEQLLGFCSSWRNSIRFFWWSEQDSYLRGQYQSAAFYPDLVNGEFETSVIPFTGTRNGDLLILEGFSHIVTGVLEKAENGTEILTLYWPDEQTGTIESEIFMACTAADYNEHLSWMNKQREHDTTATASAATATQDAAIRATATQQAVIDATATVWRQATITQQAERNATIAAVQQTVAPTQTANAEIGRQRRAVITANSELQNAITELEEQIVVVSEEIASADFESVFNSFETAWVDMQTEDQEMRTAVNQQPLTCIQLNQVRYALNRVGYAANRIDYADNQLGYAPNRIDYEEVTALQQDMRKVELAFAQLEIAVADNTTGVPVPDFTLDEVNEVIRRAQAQLDSIVQVEGRAEVYRQNSALLLENAQIFVSSLTCTG